MAFGFLNSVLSVTSDGFDYSVDPAIQGYSTQLILNSDSLSVTEFTTVICDETGTPSSDTGVTHITSATITRNAGLSTPYCTLVLEWSDNGAAFLAGYIAVIKVNTTASVILNINNGVLAETPTLVFTNTAEPFNILVETDVPNPSGYDQSITLALDNSSLALQNPFTVAIYDAAGTTLLDPAPLTAVVTKNTISSQYCTLSLNWLSDYMTTLKAGLSVTIRVNNEADVELNINNTVAASVDNIFLETDVKLDASVLRFDGTPVTTIDTYFTVNQSLTVPAEYTGVVYAEDGVTVTTDPFTVTLIPVGSRLVKMTLLFTSFDTIQFGVRRKVKISNTWDIFVELNYGTSFVSGNWSNSDDTTSLSNLDFNEGLKTRTLNNKLKSIYQTCLLTLNQLKKYISLYSYRDKYLQDIIDFAIHSGVAPDSLSASLVYSGNNISSQSTIYPLSRSRNNLIRITYNYGTYNVVRFQKRSGTVTNENLETTTQSLLNGFSINAINSNGVLLYNLGYVTINRQQQEYNVGYLKDYDAGNTAAENTMSDFKYYKIYRMIGWTVNS